MKRLQLIALFWLLTSALSATAAAQPAAVSAPQAPSEAAAPSTDTASPPPPILEYAPPPAEYARAKAYSNAHYRHFFINAFYGFLILLVLLRWRVAPWFRNLAERVSSRRSVQLIIFAPLILLTIAILGIPSDIWDQSLQRAFGLSVQTWPSWVTDWIT